MAKERIEPNFTEEGDAIVTYSRVSSRADRPTTTAGLVDKKRRSGGARFILFGATLAIVAGVVVLATSLGVATFVPTSEPVPEVTEDAPASEIVSTGVRPMFSLLSSALL